VAKANLVAVAGPARPGGLALSGHVDVVPWADQPGWTRDPLRLEIEDRRVYGRGTSDMKGFLAQCLDAVRRLDRTRLERPLHLLLTSDEEVGCLGAARLVESLPVLLGEYPPPALAWIGEPTGWRVFHAHKGVVGFRVQVRGEGGHSSVPEAGVNAIAVAAQAIATIGALQRDLRRSPSREFQALFPEAPYTTVNLGTIRGGTANNMIAESCEFTLSYRPLPDEDPLRLHRQVAERLADPPADWGSDRRGQIRVGEPQWAPGMLSPRGTPLEAALRARLDPPAGEGAPFCTDGGQLARAGIHCLICGPGDLEQAHRPDESVSRAAFEAGADHVLAVVQCLCGGA